MFYVIEGVDGSGKTSVGRKLSDIAQINYLETPSESFKKVNPKPSDNDIHERFDYFMRANIHAVNELNHDSLNVIGRYYASTIIGNSLLYNSPLESIENMARGYTLEEPVDTFLLVIDGPEQIKRITDRNQGKHGMNDYKVLFDLNYRRKMNECYLSKARKNGWKIIDTTNKSIDNVAKEILPYIA